MPPAHWFGGVGKISHVVVQQDSHPQSLEQLLLAGGVGEQDSPHAGGEFVACKATKRGSKAPPENL